MTAQFLTREPIEAITRQPYSYAGNDPINFTDPSGLCWPFCAPKIVIDVAGGIVNGVTLGHGKDALNAVGSLFGEEDNVNKVDWNSTAATVGGVLGIAADIPILFPSVARAVGLAGAQWGISAASVHEFAGTASFLLGAYDAYVRNTPQGYLLAWGGALLYLGVPGAGLFDVFTTLNSVLGSGGNAWASPASQRLVC